MNATLPAVPVLVWLIGFVLINTVVNAMGIKLTAAVTWVMLAGELIVLGLFVGFGIWAIATGRGHFTWDPLFDPDTFTWTLVFGAVSIAVLSFLGFDGISMLAEDPQRGEARGPGDGHRARSGPGCC
jgi:amino acid transporter